MNRPASHASVQIHLAPVSSLLLAAVSRAKRGSCAMRNSCAILNDTGWPCVMVNTKMRRPMGQTMML
eukprot:8071923-Pyramimonas_sp.AAC.1